MDLEKSLDTICQNMASILIYSDLEEIDEESSLLVSQCKQVICRANRTHHTDNTLLDRTSWKLIENCTRSIRLPPCKEDLFPSLAVEVEDFVYNNIQSNLLPIPISLLLYLVTSHGTPRRLLVLAVLLVLVGMLTTRFKCTREYQLMRRLHAENLDILSRMTDTDFNISHPLLEINNQQHWGNWMFERFHQFLGLLFSTLYVNNNEMWFFNYSIQWINEKKRF